MIGIADTVRFICLQAIACACVHNSTTQHNWPGHPCNVSLPIGPHKNRIAGSHATPQATANTLSQDVGHRFIPASYINLR